MRTEDRSTYASAVWDEFRQVHQPGRLTMSSSEFQLVSRWMDRSIPLPVVLRGLEETGGKPRTLHACENAVERAYRYWHEAMGGL